MALGRRLVLVDRQSLAELDLRLEEVQEVLGGRVARLCMAQVREPAGALVWGCVHKQILVQMCPRWEVTSSSREGAISQRGASHGGPAGGQPGDPPLQGSA